MTFSFLRPDLFRAAQSGIPAMHDAARPGRDESFDETEM
jgi:hypothetical protein